MDNQKIFRSSFSESIFNYKYKHEGAETWAELSKTLIEDVCRDNMSREEKDELIEMHTNMEFIAGGRYLYYAGRANKFFNNCYLLKSLEDTREDWANLSWKAISALMTGGGIGNNYDIYRPKGSLIKRTGGKASGPISMMKILNENGREVMQGGSRRSAIYASLNWLHGDAGEFLHCKDWASMPVAGAYNEQGEQLTIADLKEMDFNYPAPLDMTNISLNYDNKFLEEIYGLSFNELLDIYKEGGKNAIFKLPIVKIPITFLENCRQALKTGEPGFSFNFFEKVLEVLRNAPISGDTQVLTKDGYKKVYDIVSIEQELWTGKQWAKATFRKTMEQIPTLAIGFTGGRRIEAESEHEFLVDRYIGRGKKRKLKITEKVKAKNLEIGDILNVSLPSKNSEIFNSKSYTIGYAYGDGSFRSGGANGGEITFCTEGSKKCFEYTDHTMYSSFNRNDSRGYIRAYISATELKGGRNKEILPINEVNLSFIAGLFDSDGNYDISQNRVRLSNKSFEFLNDVRRVLESYGILSGISTLGISTYGNKIGYSLTIMSDFTDKFKELVPTKRLNINDHKSYRNSLIKVTSILIGRIQDVFCCDVKVNEHSFMAEGVIISNCTEVTSEDDSDVCNLASVNMSRIKTTERFARVNYLVSRFLLCGTLVAELPYKKVYEIREKNRRLGLGLMGVHEWLLQRGYKYEVTPELHDWLAIYRDNSEIGANELADTLKINRPIAYRAIAPTGTIGIMAGTTTGIEPLFAVAYKRRYLKGQKEWHYQYVIDGTAKLLIKEYGIDPYKIETALSLANDYERRIKFQADIQDYVDMSISSTINLPSWGTSLNNDTRVDDFARVLAKYAIRLRGFTCYPDGSRGGQPLTIVDYQEARKQEGQEYKEEFMDVCSLTGGGTCSS